MTSTDDVKAMVLTDLAAICKKLAAEPAVLEHLRVKAGQLADEYNSLPQDPGRSTNFHHLESAELLIRIARFLPRIVDEEIDTTRTFQGTPEEVA